MSQARPDSNSPRDQLLTLRTPLIELHRALLETERRHYEGVNGRVSAAELLQLALQNEQFSWLHQISTIIVRVDELIAGDVAPGVGEVTVLATHIRTLLHPDPHGSAFERRYDRAVQDDPSVLLAHRLVMQTLPPDPSKGPETIH